MEGEVFYALGNVFLFASERMINAAPGEGLGHTGVALHPSASALSSRAFLCAETLFSARRSFQKLTFILIM